MNTIQDTYEKWNRKWKNLIENKKRDAAYLKFNKTKPLLLEYMTFERGRESFATPGSRCFIVVTHPDYTKKRSELTVDIEDGRVMDIEINNESLSREEKNLLISYFEEFSLLEMVKDFNQHFELSVAAWYWVGYE